MAVSDRSAAGCWLGSTRIWTSVFQILLYSVQYSFSRIPAAAAAEFHNGTQSQPIWRGSSDCVYEQDALYSKPALYGGAD
jgi:hypothetical protein